MKSKAVWIYAVLFFITISCKNDNYKYNVKPQAGIFLSFDDSYVDDWFSLRNLFLKYDARVTFFISNFNSLTIDQIEKLKVLQSDGHEIGFHGAMHVQSESYIKEHSMDEYLQNEIIAGINAMNEKEFYPTCFAYPFGAKYWGTDRELLKYFYVIRSVAPLKSHQDITKFNEIYYTFDGSRLISSLSIDKDDKLKAKDIEHAITRCKNNKEVLMLYGHTFNTTVRNSKYSFDVSFLEEILKVSKQQSLKFFRASDLVR